MFTGKGGRLDIQPPPNPRATTPVRFLTPTQTHPPKNKRPSIRASGSATVPQPPHRSTELLPNRCSGDRRGEGGGEEL
ncbi:hypothetical protein PBY51_014419 [Eleginops maclovinus]|uniref:Uncharacterized protein n=1 Tax=Eleginops maclovinus TaxID=56733 RepID=A0AAN7WZ10_ELEMC|nr:hypothetical protein PBY51_014419 [Eleginops maclovinus]